MTDEAARPPQASRAAPLLAPPLVDQLVGAPADQEAAPTTPVQIIYWGLTDWSAIWQRPQQLAAALAAHHSVLYVRPWPLSRWRPGRARPPAIQRLGPHLSLVGPPALSPDRIGLVRRLNVAWTARMIQRQLARSLPTVLWLSHPDQAAHIGHYREAVVCYDLMDDHVAFKSGPSAVQMARVEQALLRRVDLVFATSADLRRRAESAGAPTVLVPNAADLRHFATAATRPLPPPPELERLAGPRLLYYGTLGSWVDLTLVAAIARARPDWQVLLVGPRADLDPRPADGLANIHWLGVRPYADLPAFLQHTDVCLLPFVSDRLTRAVDPVKVYEYLAAGRPVVATPLPELARCGDLIDPATTADEAITAIERHLCQPESETRRLSRLAYAVGHTWTARAAVINQAIAARLGERSARRL